MADGIRAVVLDCATMPYVDVTAARMLNQLSADLPRHRVRLLLAAVGKHHETSEYHRTLPEAVTAARAAPASVWQRQPSTEEE